jgi:arylsulfatase A-like enzyme
METTARIPLFIRDPARPDSHGQRFRGLVESLDIYPTIVDIVGLRDKQASLWPPLEGEARGRTVAWDTRAQARRHDCSTQQPGLV